MSNNDEVSRDKRLSAALYRACGQLIQQIENEPDFILEGEAQSVDGEKVLREIRAWLFGRRRTDGHTDNSADK